MANPKSLVLFPPPPMPPVPKITLPNPHYRRPSLTTRASKAYAPETVIKSENGESVIVKVEETGSSRPSSSEIGLALSSRSSSFTSAQIVVPASPIDGHSHSPSPQHPQPPPPPPAPYVVSSRFGSPTEFNLIPPRQVYSPAPPSVRSDAATLVRCGSQMSTVTSPVAPIRSIFPVYNPSVPLSQQSYYPQRTTSLSSRYVSRDDYSSRVATPSQFDRAVGGPKTAPPSVCSFAADVMSIPETRYSSQKELDVLWEASHGMEANDAVGTYTLEMARMSEAVFTFGSDPLAPFYTLMTFDTNEISVSKTSPRKRTNKCEIVQSSIEPQERRLPPNDGLVTLIFPKLAAMLAIDQSTELAREHNLAPTHKDEVITSAIQRAANQEACRLLWNAQARRYELEHAAIGRNARNPEFAASPVSPQDVAKPVLHITVSTHGVGSPMLSPTAPPVIFMTNPNAIPSPSNSASAGIRMSAVPQPEIDNPLAYLDFGNMTLHIDAYQILDLMPSLFAIDSLVSALLAVAIADPTTNPAMATMDIWTSVPKAPGSVFGGASMKSYAGSAFFATIAEREEAEEEAKLMKMLHEKDVKEKNKPEKRGFFGGKKEKKAKKTKVVTVKEFDLEKLGHYQAGDRKGEELPAVTRGVLELLISGLKMIVWFLTMIVQMIAWLLVNISRAVTSEKF